MFYCQRVVGDAEFSIEEWNKQFKICCDLDIEMPDEPEPCTKQCFDCMAIVGERQLKTKKLLMTTLTTRPLFDRVILKEAPKEQSKMKGGFVFTDTDKARVGQVMAIGPGTAEEPTEVPVGATVVFSKYGGTPITLDNEDYLLMKEKDIHAIV
jgi:chaperonin GroES